MPSFRSDYHTKLNFTLAQGHPRVSLILPPAKDGQHERRQGLTNVKVTLTVNVGAIYGKCSEQCTTHVVGGRPPAGTERRLTCVRNDLRPLMAASMCHILRV